MRSVWCAFVGAFALTPHVVVESSRVTQSLLQEQHGGLVSMRIRRQTWRNSFNSYMDELKATKSPDGFNTEKCNPYIKGAEDTKSKGIVLLLHGYSACPGFWYLFDEPLVQQGWTVVAPLMVGHGRNPNKSNVKDEKCWNEDWVCSDGQCTTDYSEDLPESSSGYEAFANELIDIVQQYKDENPNNEIVVAGISHGGAVTTYLAMGAPHLWNRVLLMNPFLQPPTQLGAEYGVSFMRDVIPLVLPGIQALRGSDRMSWGEGCEPKRCPGDPRNGGHGGFCNFHWSRFAGVLQFANTVEKRMRALGAEQGHLTGGLINRLDGALRFGWHKTAGRLFGNAYKPNYTIQLVTSIKDGAIANSRVHWLDKAFERSPLKDKVGFCVFPEEFKHVYQSNKDYVNRDQWWLDEKKIRGGKTVVDMFVDFIVAGKFVPKSTEVVAKEQDQYIENDPICDVQHA